MTIIQCDLCGKRLLQGVAPTKVLISEFKADSCDPCAKKLITFVKTAPYKNDAQNKGETTL